MRVKLQSTRFTARTQNLIDVSDRILTDYYNQGMPITLRKLFYELVSRNIISNTENDYKSLGDHITNGRMAGLIDWDHIVDESRTLVENTHYDNPQEILRSAANSYRMDMWVSQPSRVEVWVEKMAVAAILRPICRDYDVKFMACRGQASTTIKYELRQRVLETWNTNYQNTIVLYFGDHDPSGMAIPEAIEPMVEDIRLDEMQICRFERLALNLEQTSGLLPNPAKQTDKNYKRYQQTYGDVCWELDAMDYRQLQQILKSRLVRIIDWDRWSEMLDRQNQGRQWLDTIIGQGG